MTQDGLTGRERRLLLEIARQAIEAEATGMPQRRPMVGEPGLLQHRGAFVTLHRGRKLRGCIGTFVAKKALADVVADMAISAASRDPRFPPLNKTELPEVEIEISALTPLKPIKDVEEIEVGRHGIYIIREPFRGVLLPQVATEYGWDRETFLDQTCVKAGLAPGCWREPGTQILIFSAEVFNEASEGIPQRTSA